MRSKGFLLSLCLAVGIVGGVAEAQSLPECERCHNLEMVREHQQEMLDRAVNFIRTKTDIVPEFALILGSGLGDLANLVEDRVEIPYSDIPGFALSTAEGHAGKLVFGKIEGRNVVIMQGRVHLYEGYNVRNVVFPVNVMRALGAKALIVTNACGAVGAGHYLGEVVLIKDHINFLGVNPMIGMNEDKIGPRFFDMNTAYDPSLRQLALDKAKKFNIHLKEGVYGAMTGPSYETPAERGMMRAIGADIVGMSTVPEVIAAVHCGFKVVGFSCVTDVPADIPGEKVKNSTVTTHEEVLQAAQKAQSDLERLVREIVRDYKL